MSDQGKFLKRNSSTNNAIRQPTPSTLSQSPSEQGTNNEYLERMASDPQFRVSEFLKILEVTRQKFTGRQRKEGECFILYRVAEAYFDARDYHRSISCGLEALSLARELGDSGFEANILANLGAAYAPAGDLLKGVDAFMKALNIYYSRGSLKEAAVCSLVALQ